MAASYPGHASSAVVADAGGSAAAAYDLDGLVAGISLNAVPQIEAGYYIGSPVQRQHYNAYNIEMAFESLRKGAASDGMAAWVAASGNPEAWVALAAANGNSLALANRAYFGRRRFASSDFTSDFTTIYGANITMEQRGTVYRGERFAVDLSAAGSLSATLPTPATAGWRALLIVTAITQTVAVTLDLGGQSITGIENVGAYFTTADLSQAALTAAFGGTFTQLEGYLYVGLGIV